MAAVFSRLPMRVRCATQRDHVFHPEMNYSQTQLDQLDRLTSPSGGWPTISRRARPQKKTKNSSLLSTPENVAKTVGGKVERNGDILCCCPVHEVSGTHNPSLVLTITNDHRILFHCR